MKLLVFEYSSICLCDNLLSEGTNMLKCVLNDLKDSPIFEVYCLINKNIDLTEYDNIKAINLEYDLFEWLKIHSKNFDYCLFIAPEDDLIQFNITRILEENRVQIIGCDSKSSYICSSKDLTYENVPSNVLKIKSFKFKSDEITYEMIKDKLKTPFLIKPDDRTSSDLIFIIDNKKICEKVRDVYVKNNIEHLLVQEYVEGTPISVSLVCNEKNVTMISVNSQEIEKNNNKIMYMGCKTPIEHPLEKELDEISRNIVLSIPGLKGFVGIDYIVQDKTIFFVEINSRITTPYIVLQKNCRENLTCSIIDYVIHEKNTIDLTFERQGKFIR